MLHDDHRPTTLAEVIGQDQAIQQIRRITTRPGWKGGAILIHGPTSCGKTTIARAAAKEITGHELAVKTVESKDCTLDTLRTVEEDMHHTSLWGNGKKAYILDEAHEITPGAQGYALGLLERIPPNRVILATSTENPTFSSRPLQSRWISVRIEPLEPSTIAERLKHIAEKEGVKLPVDYALADAIKRRHYNLRQCINDIIEGGQIF